MTVFVLTLTVVAIAAIPGAAQWLQYDRAAIFSGETWRLITGHLTHWNAEHLIWDAAMFAVFGWLCWRQDRARFAVAAIGSAMLISLFTMALSPDIEIYRGLSGIDSALFALAAVMGIRQFMRERRHVFALIVVAALIGFAAKIGFEIATGATLFVDSTAAGFTPLPMPHLIGAAAGALVGTRGVSRLCRHSVIRSVPSLDARRMKRISQSH